MKTILALLCVGGLWLARAEAGSFAGPEGCRAFWDETTLTVGNSLFSRSWRSDGKMLRTVSFGLSADERPFVVDEPTGDARPGLNVSCCVDRSSPVSEPSLLVSAEVGGRMMRIRLYPSVPGVVVSRDWDDVLPPAPSAKDYEAANNDAWGLVAGATNRMDCLAFPYENLRLTTYRFNDQTDVHDTLMETRTLYGRTVERPQRHLCSMVDAYDPVSRRGAVFLRLAPQPDSRPGDTPDFLSDANRLPIKLVPVANGYPMAELLYLGSPDERIAALHALQRAIRPYRPHRDGLFLSNTWGGGNSDLRINAHFLEKEIDAGAEIGVDVIQIDDGWQHGRTPNSKSVRNGEGVWSGYWAADRDFWTPDRTRFPDGLDPLVARARARGLRFGLWFGPDSSGEAANWERDADCLLDYYRRLGIGYFKIDSLELQSGLGFARCRKMFDKMLAASDGEMVFDLDSTAQVRPGYFGMMDIGPVFVENRYAGRSYRPWATLASLWQLSHAIDPLRLRMEVVDPDPQCAARDGNDLLAAVHWPLDAGFAIAMFASPLGWMELSEMRPERRAAMKFLVATWKRERERLYSGVTFPVGSRPDGFSWTGFVNRSADGSGGYALLFREANESSRFSMPIACWFKGRCVRSEVIGGRGSATLSPDGKTLTVDVPIKLDFVWVRLEAGEGLMRTDAENRGSP